MIGLIATLTVAAFENMDNIYILADAYRDMGMVDEASRIMNLDFRPSEYSEAMLIVYKDRLSVGSLSYNVLKYKEGSVSDRKFVEFLISLQPELRLLVDSVEYENQLGVVARERVLNDELEYEEFKAIVKEKVKICRLFDDYKNCAGWKKLKQAAWKFKGYLSSKDAWQ